MGVADSRRTEELAPIAAVSRRATAALAIGAGLGAAGLGDFPGGAPTAVVDARGDLVRTATLFARGAARRGDLALALLRQATDLARRTSVAETTLAETAVGTTFLAGAVGLADTLAVDAQVLCTRAGLLGPPHAASIDGGTGVVSLGTRARLLPGVLALVLDAGAASIHALLRGGTGAADPAATVIPALLRRTGQCRIALADRVLVLHAGVVRWTGLR